MSDLEFDPGTAVGESLQQMDRQELCRFVARLCLHLKAEVGSRAYRGGIFPENIRMNEAGEFAIGPAKLEKWSGQELEFVAPELYWHGQSSPAADVYSLGLLLYYGLGGGKLPFETATVSGQLARMSGKVLPAPKAAGKRLGEVMEKATAFQTSDRYDNPEQLQIMLESCLDNKYLEGASGAEAVFQKEDGELSEIERMMVDIIERSSEETAEAGEEAVPELALEEMSPEEQAGLEKPEPVPMEKEDLTEMVEEFFGFRDPETMPDPEDAEDVRLYEPSHEKKERLPIPILTEEKNPELAPVVLRQQPRYSRNLEDPEQRQKEEAEVKKRRSRRPLAVVMILCVLLLAGAVAVKLLWDAPRRPTQINPTPDPSAFYNGESAPEETREPTPEGEQPTVVPIAPRYVIEAGDFSWTQARDICLEQGGHLAVISTREEFEEITRLAEERNLTRLWIGCHRENGELVWETDEPVNFSNWAANEPSFWDDYDGVAEDYIMIYREGDQWFYNDNRNDPAADYPEFYSGTMGYVCELEG